jgi:hypothetical protein
LRDDVVGVAGVVDASLFLWEEVAPVLLEVAVGAQGSELEDGFATFESPAAAGDVHADFDEVAAGALDDASGDWPTWFEGGGIVQVGPLVGQRVGAGVRVGPLGGSEAESAALPGCATTWLALPERAVRAF